MSDFITNELDKIMESNHYDFPLNVAMVSAWILGNFKASNLKIYEVSNRTAMADYFVIASTTNPVQSTSAAQEISKQMKRLGQPPKSIEGKESADWILLDLGDIIVHIFNEVSRDSYALDQIWGDCKQVEIPQEYYFSGSDTPTNDDSGENYF